jgi:hypothetical protein
MAFICYHIGQSFDEAEELPNGSTRKKGQQARKMFWQASEFKSVITIGRAVLF